ncbi:MAG: hypothetical protein AB1384_14090 [Actinomycetota bacterium]
MAEIFYEDILDTFLFCFIAALGIIQIMVAKRGWHGLNLYGGRTRRAVSYPLGASLVFFAYAWYFSDPLHRNVRNIEAFMSLVCLVLGIAAAAALSVVLASASEAMRRRYGRGRRGRDGAGPAMERLELPAGSVLASEAWGEPGMNLVVLAEPGKGSEDLIRSLCAATPGGHGMLSVHPRLAFDDLAAQGLDAAEMGVPGLLAQVERECGVSLRGETILGLGWGGNTLEALLPVLERDYAPRRLFMVAPVTPDCEHGFVGDASLSDTPWDMLVVLFRQKPWKDAGFGRLVRIWLPVLAPCVILATAVTVGFDVRWKLFSGPLTGLLISLWVTYFLARRRGARTWQGREARLAAHLCGTAPGGGLTPLTTVMTSENLETAAPSAREGPDRAPARIELWEDVLRGKFILDRGTPGRLATLIWEAESGT